MRLLVTMLALAACSTRKAEEPWVPPPAPPIVADAGAPAELVKMFGAPSPRGTDYKQLETFRDQAAPDEKPLIDAMISAMHELDAATTDTAHERDHQIAGTRKLIAAMRALADHSTRDVGPARLAVSSLAMIPFQIENMGLADQFDLAALRAETLDRARALVKSFPTDARSWKQLAFQLADPLDAMRAYQKCSKLDPALGCETTLASMRDRYTAPFCTAAAIDPSFGWFEASETATQPVPAYSSKHLVRLHADVSHMNAHPVTDARTGAVIDQIPASDTPVVVLELRPEVVKPMARWIQGVQARGHFLVLKLGARVLADTHNSYESDHEIPAWQVTGIELADVCKHIERQALPPDLR